MAVPRNLKNGIVTGLCLLALIVSLSVFYWIGHTAGTVHSDVKLYAMMVARASGDRLHAFETLEEANLRPLQIFQWVSSEARCRRESAPTLRRAKEELMNLVNYLCLENPDRTEAVARKDRILQEADRLLEIRLDTWYEIRDKLEDEQLLKLRNVIDEITAQVDVGG